MSLFDLLSQTRPGDNTNLWICAGASVVTVAIYLARRSKKTPRQRTARAAKPAAMNKPGAAKPMAARPQPPKLVPFQYPTHPLIQPPPGVAPSTRPLTPIESVRRLMGPAPRTFDPSLANYLKISPPAWLQSKYEDELWLSIEHQERARREGPVVWSTYVQANVLLFQRNNAESPASVIYSSDPWFDRNREVLGQIAKQCFALKGTDPIDDESATYARMLTNELMRGMRLSVPRVFTGGRQVYHSSMLMPRKQLPKGFVSSRFFPIWIDPKQTGAVIMVPAAFWPASLTAEWSSD